MIPLKYTFMKTIFILLATLFIVFTAQSQTAAEFCKSADAKFNAENFSGAITDYSSAIKADPKYTEAYIWRADSYYRLDKNSEAVTDYTTAISLDPEYGFLYN